LTEVKEEEPTDTDHEARSRAQRHFCPFRQDIDRRSGSPLMTIQSIAVRPERLRSYTK